MRVDAICVSVPEFPSFGDRLAVFRKVISVNTPAIHS